MSGHKNIPVEERRRLREKKIKKQYPDINLLFLDFDYGTSQVNVHNRLHFMLMEKEAK